MPTLHPLVVPCPPAGPVMSPVLGVGGGGAGFAIDLLLVLACAGAVAMVFGRLKLAAIPGYLLAGILIGPSVLGLVSGAERVEELSGVAMIVLMFGIGMHMDASILKRGAAAIIAIGTVSTIANMLALWPIFAVWTGSARTGLACGMALSMSSTAVVLRILQQRREMSAPHGRLAFGILLVQDLFAILFLALIPVLGAFGAAAEGVDGAGEASGGVLGELAGMARMVGGVAALIVVGKLVLPRVLDEAARTGGVEVLLVVASAAALGAAVLTASLGLSAELGAFTAGFLLSGTRFRWQLTGQLAPLRDLFMAVFFTTMGLKVELAAIGTSWWLIPLGIVLIPTIKAAVIGVTAWAFGASPGVGARTGTELGQGGEFSLVLISAATSAGLVVGTPAAVILAAVIGTLILTPLATVIARKLGRGLQDWRTAPWLRVDALCDGPVKGVGPNTDSGSGQVGGQDPGADAAARPRTRRVIIAGYGPVGRNCADRVEQLGVACTIIELNAKTVARQAAAGRRIVYGDASSVEVLESAGILDADGVVLALPDADATLRAVGTIRKLNPDIHIAARTNFLSQAHLAHALGANHVTVEEVATAQALAAHVIEHLRDAEAMRAEKRTPRRDAPDPRPAD